MKGLAALAVVAVALVAATPAAADRAPGKTERKALARAAGISPDCAAVRISTVRHRFKWAAVRTRRRCLERRSFSFPEIYRRKRAEGAPWRLRWSFADGCDTLYERVPEKVADDLGFGCAIG